MSSDEDGVAKRQRLDVDDAAQADSALMADLLLPPSPTPASSLRSSASSISGVISVFTEEGTDDSEIYEVEKVIEHRYTPEGAIEYRVKWKGWGHKVRPLRLAPAACMLRKASTPPFAHSHLPPPAAAA